MHPAAIVLSVSVICAAAVAIAWMYRQPVIAKAKREEKRAESIDSVVTELRAEFGRAIEQVMDLEESIKRHRARIDGAKRGNPAPDPAQPELALDPQAQLASLTLDQVRQLDQDTQREWVRLRRLASGGRGRMAMQ